MKFRIPMIAFLIPFIILLFSFRLVVFDVGLYKSEFERHGVYDKFDKSVADPAVENLISYMKSGSPLSNFFNEKEKTHMADVKSIIQKLSIFLYILLSVLVISFLSSKKYFFKSLFYGGILTLAVILLFLIFSFFSFDFIFYKFHELSFSNEFWKLNPETDYLKALMPDSFFYNALMRIFFISSITSVIFIFVGFLGLKKSRLQARKT